jgi:dihydrofolate reductase
MAHAPLGTRRVRYAVAASLDGYIAGPNGEFDWIVMDPDIDFGTIFKSFDTMLVGRKTYEVTRQHQGGPAMPGMKVFVFSKTLKQKDCQGVTISDDAIETVASLQKQPGKDIWLFGGGALFRSLLDAGLVDAVEVGIVPVLLGGGVPFLPPPAHQAKLVLRKHKIYPKTGTVSLEYATVRDAF